jgi:magnesium transporter
MGYGADRLEERDLESVAALKDFRHRALGVLWVNIEGVGDAATFKELGDLFGLHSLALEDVVNLHQRPKAEDYDDHVYVVLQKPASDDIAALEQVSIFFGSDYVITVQKGLPGDYLEPLRQRIRGARGRIRQRGADYLAYAVMDAIIDSFFPVVEQLNSRLEQFEDEVVNLTGHEVVTEIHAARHDLHVLRRVLASSREAIGLLVRGETGPVSEPILPFLRDCHDHTAQLLDAVEALRELVVGLMDLHLAETSNRMNEVMKILTIIATIFIPLSFIAGLYGMNFDRTSSSWNMPELGWRLGYPFALSLMVATSVGFLLYFRHRGWLGKPRQ